VEDRGPIEAGQLVGAMISSRGWREIARPSLDARRQQLVHEMLNANDFKQFIYLQQSINAIDNLLEFIEITIQQGKEELKKEHPHVADSE